MSIEGMRFGEYIREKRLADRREITLREMSAALGISLSLLSDIEQGRRSPFDSEKIRIDGHTVVVNRRSMYIDGKMEFQALNLITEYGQKLNGCKYAVASRYSRDRLEELYTENLKKFSPFIYLTEEEYAPIRESNNNNNKHHMRDVNNHDDYGYTDDMMEAMHDSCELLCGEPEPDVLTALIEGEDEAQRNELIEALPAAMASLPEKQRRRVIMHVYEGRTFREIAELEGTKGAPINISIQKAKKNLRKYLNKIS